MKLDGIMEGKLSHKKESFWVFKKNKKQEKKVKIRKKFSFSETFKDPRKVIVITLLGLVFLTRVLPYIFQPNALFSIVDGYDEYVHYVNAANIVSGFAPYKHFLFLHPPFILLIYIPFALIGKATTDIVGVACARVFVMILSVVNAYLIYRVIKTFYEFKENKNAVNDTVKEDKKTIRKKFFSQNFAIVFALGIYATYSVFVDPTRVGMIEPFLNLCVLGSILLLIKGLKTGLTRYFVFLGILLGISFFFKVWAVIDIVAFATVLLFLFNKKNAVKGFNNKIKENKGPLVFFASTLGFIALVFIIISLTTDAKGFFYQVFALQVTRSIGKASIGVFFNSLNPFTGLLFILPLMIALIVVVIGLFVCFGYTVIKNKKNKNNPAKVGDTTLFSNKIGKEAISFKQIKKTVKFLLLLQLIIRVVFFAASRQVFWHYMAYILLPGLLLLSIIFSEYIFEKKQILYFSVAVVLLFAGSMFSLSYLNQTSVERSDYLAKIVNAKALSGTPETLVDTNFVYKTIQSTKKPIHDPYAEKINAYCKTPNTNNGKRDFDFDFTSFNKEQYLADKRYTNSFIAYRNIISSQMLKGDYIVLTNELIDFDIFEQYILSRATSYEQVYKDSCFVVYKEKETDGFSEKLRNMMKSLEDKNKKELTKTTSKSTAKKTTKKNK